MQPVPLRFRLLAAPLKLFFKLLYHQFAWTYDWVAAIVSLGLWQDWILSIVPFINGGAVLEMGHGPGHLQEALLVLKNSSSQGITQVVGLDASPQMGRQASRRLRKKGLEQHLVNGMGQSLPFASRTFQQVVATFPTEYIMQEDTLQEIWRVLAPGGVLIVVPSAWITGESPLQKAAAWLFRFTGQAPERKDGSLLDERALEPVHKLGFSTDLHWIKLPTSLVLAVTARKAVE